MLQESNNNDAKSIADPAHSAKPATNPAIRKALKATTGRMKPETVMLGATAATPACGVAKEIVTLEEEDMPAEIDGEGFVCRTCYEIIPKDRYVSHRRDRSCHSLARPPEAEQDKFNCNTCHRHVIAKPIKPPCVTATACTRGYDDLKTSSNPSARTLAQDSQTLLNFSGKLCPDNTNVLSRTRQIIYTNMADIVSINSEVGLDQISSSIRLHEA